MPENKNDIMTGKSTGERVEKGSLYFTFGTLEMIKDKPTQDFCMNGSLHTPGAIYDILPTTEARIGYFITHPVGTTHSVPDIDLGMRIVGEFLQTESGSRWKEHLTLPLVFTGNDAAESLGEILGLPAMGIETDCRVTNLKGLLEILKDKCLDAVDEGATPILVVRYVTFEDLMRNIHKAMSAAGGIKKKEEKPDGA